MTNTYYGIDDGFGNQLTTGLGEHDARQTAVRLAAELRQAVYSYEVGSQDAPEVIAPPDESEGETIMTKVVTYQHAYLSNEIELCARHADSEHPTTRRIFGVLGPVNHGQHRGECAACEAESNER